MNMIKRIDFKLSHILNVLSYIVALLPVVWLVLFIVVHVSIESVFGYTAAYNRPSQLEYTQHTFINVSYHILIIFWIISMWCIVYIYPALLMTHIVFRFKYHLKIDLKHIFYYSIGAICIGNIVSYSHPTLLWILD